MLRGASDTLLMQVADKATPAPEVALKYRLAPLNATYVPSNAGERSSARPIVGR